MTVWKRFTAENHYTTEDYILKRKEKKVFLCSIHTLFSSGSFHRQDIFIHEFCTKCQRLTAKKHLQTKRPPHNNNKH